MRLLECAGLGTLAGAAAGLLVVPLFIYRGEPAMRLAVMLPAAGAICGAVWGFVRRPRILAALLAADRQYALKDLLSTAWLLRGAPACEVMRAVRTQAERRAAALSPAQVRVHRLGARSWCGIGLAAALVLVLGLISAGPGDAGMSPGAEGLLARTVATRPEAARPSGAPDWLSRPDSSAVAPDYLGVGDEQLDPRARLVSDPKRAATGEEGHRADAADPRGAGGGAARSEPARAADPIAIGPTTGGRDDASGAAVAGGVGAAANGNGVRGRTGIATGGDTESLPQAPWQAASWNEARSAAEEAISRGEIPADCRDIVKAYFSR